MSVMWDVEKIGETWLQDFRQTREASRELRFAYLHCLPFLLRHVEGICLKHFRIFL